MLAQHFDLQGHRGARGLAPENTLLAFTKAMEIGVTTLELDTAISRDGVVIVAHDRRLNPDITRDQSAHWIKQPTPAVHALTFAQIKTFDVGRIDPGSPYFQRFPEQQGIDGLSMPTLADVFELAQSRHHSTIRFNIETKLSPLYPDEAPPAEKFARLLIDVVEAAGMAKRVTIQSFDWRTLRLAGAINKDVALSYLSTQQGNENTLQGGEQLSWTDGFHLTNHASAPHMISAHSRVNDLASDRRIIWSPNFKDLTPSSINEAHALNIEVIPWTVNDPDELGQIIQSGADGLITDYPDRARTIMAHLGMPLP